MKAVNIDLGVAACIVQDRRILLVKEARGTTLDLWGMPKGAVDKYEAPATAVLRELNEECGITGKVVGLIAVRERIYKDIPGIFIAYSVTTEDTEIRIDQDEISDYGWFKNSEFDNINWISKAMRDIAESALEGKILSVTDYTTIEKGHYVVYS